MSKIHLVLILSVFIGMQKLDAQTLPIENVRDQYFAFDKSEDAALKLYKLLENKNLSKDLVMIAYRGSASAAAAASVKGPWNKLEYFNRGKKELEKAVSLKPLDAEIRFLRLATQVNAPAFLGYSGNKKNDKAIILQTLIGVNSDHPNAYLYLRICRFMLARAELDESEKITINQLIVKFNTKK